MKKSLFITIAILVIASVLCFAAFAENSQEITGVSSDSSDYVDTKVYAKLGDVETTYSITVDFGEMNFTYDCKWDPETATYTNGSWNSDSNWIIVTNKSNASISIKFGFTLSNDFLEEEITPTFTEGENDGEKWIETVGSSYDLNEESVTLAQYGKDDYTISALLNLSGNTNKLTSSSQTIGTVSVTASAVE